MLRSVQQRKGQVLHVYQSMVVWLHNREYPENGGVFIARARQLAPQAPKNVSGTSSKGDLSKMNPALTANPYGAPPSGGMSGAANGGGIGRGRGGRDNLAGKSVAIIKGPYKTYRGIIKDTNGAMARVELHTMSKILTIGLDSLVEKE